MQLTHVSVVNPRRSELHVSTADDAIAIGLLIHSLNIPGRSDIAVAFAVRYILHIGKCVCRETTREAQIASDVMAFGAPCALNAEIK